MLKLISALIAICAMTVSINVSAATVGTITTPTKNNIDSLGTSDTSTDSLPTLRAGDTLQFDVSDLTANTTLTLISYKRGSEATDSTVQYINEYSLTSTSQTIDYTIRDIEDGIYEIVITGNDGKDVANFYYKVGTPKVTILTGEGGTDYYIKEKFLQANGTYLWSVAFVGKVSMGSGDVSFSDAGLTSVGLKISDTEGHFVYRDLPEEQLSALINNAELFGAITIYFGLTMYKIPENKLNTIIATPRLDKEVVSAD